MTSWERVKAQMSNPGTHRCECGERAVGRRGNDWVCATCLRIECDPVLQKQVHPQDYRPKNWVPPWEQPEPEMEGVFA